MPLTANPGRALGGRRLAALALAVSLAAALDGVVSKPSLAAQAAAAKMTAVIRMHDIAFLPQSSNLSQIRHLSLLLPTAQVQRGDACDDRRGPAVH